MTTRGQIAGASGAALGPGLLGGALALGWEVVRPALGMAMLLTIAFAIVWWLGTGGLQREADRRRPGGKPWTA